LIVLHLVILHYTTTTLFTKFALKYLNLKKNNLKIANEFQYQQIFNNISFNKLLLFIKNFIIKISQ